MKNSRTKLPLYYEQTHNYMSTVSDDLDLGNYGNHIVMVTDIQKL